MNPVLLRCSLKATGIVHILTHLKNFARKLEGDRPPA